MSAIPLEPQLPWPGCGLTEFGGAPLVDVTMLRTPTFRCGEAANTVFMCYFASFVFIIALLLPGWASMPWRSTQIEEVGSREGVVAIFCVRGVSSNATSASCAVALTPLRRSRCTQRPRHLGAWR